MARSAIIRPPHPSRGGSRQPRATPDDMQRVTTVAASAVDVSVLIPVLNEEPHIRGTVAAMLAQTFDGTFELLFAEGHSEDRTRVILQELAHEDPRIRVLDNPLRRTASGL